jgi:cyanophycinase
MQKTGVLALVGGNEWTEGCTFDATLLAASGGTEVVVLPTAAAYQHPERVVIQAAEWFATLGAQVEGIMVVDRPSAEDPGMAAAIAQARFIYLAGGSPLHLKAALKKSADPRGGALTLGLGLVDQLAVVPHYGDEEDDLHGQKLARTVAMAPAVLPIVGIPARTALIRDADGGWTYEGAAEPVVFVGGVRAEGLSALTA